GPSLSQLTDDESVLHKARKKLIHHIKSSDVSHTNMLLEQIKSEARKISLKSIEFYLRGQQNDKQKVISSIDDLNSLAEKYTRATGNTDYAKEINTLTSAYIDSTQKYISDISKRRSSVDKIYEYEEQLNKSRRSLIHMLYTLIEIEESELLEAGNLAKHSINSLINTTLFAALILILTIIVTSVNLYRTISNPILRLIEATKNIALGNLNSHIDVSTNDEIKELADAFNAMVANLKSSQEERQHALTALQEREQDLAITLNSIGDAVIVTDAEGRINRMNPIAEQLTGWPLEQAQGQSLKSVFPIIDATTREPIQNPVEKVMTSSETVFLSNHTTLIARDGSEYQIADSAAPIRNSKDEVLGMVLVFNDVTEQYHMREKILSTAQHLKLYREQAPLAAIECNTDFQVVSWNIAAEKIFGYKFEEIRGKNFTDIVASDSNMVDAEKILQEPDSYGNSEISVSEHRTKEGRLIICEWHHQILKDEGGSVIGIASIVQDITDRIQQEEQLRHSQKMDALGKLTGGIAHDYNNMLGVILGYSEILKNKLVDQPKLARYAHEVHRAGERGAKLTKKLLTFSRQGITAAKNLNINTLLLDIQHMLEKTLTARINLKLDLADDLWQVKLDESDLEDAVLNMSINAMHAIEGNGVLSIQTRNKIIGEANRQSQQIEPGEYVLLKLTDTGCGINEDTRKKIFDPFFSTKGDEGTGLGLSQVYGFVERSGGEIRLQTEPGNGTEFELYFPRYRSDDIATGSDNFDRAADHGGNETILIVDDEPALLELTSQILSQQGYHVLTAVSSKLALQILEHKTVDLLLSDVIMPEMDGYQLASIVQKKYPSIKIQLVSGFSDDRHRSMADDYLHANLISKPYQAEVILKRIRESLN
ncbi:MAG: PAS domain S-box protein, partial [Proteobacteria bacterium]|nr:PAS domain S-box protein [Pseudomonadota bacterium]